MANNKYQNTIEAKKNEIEERYQEEKRRHLKWHERSVDDFIDTHRLYDKSPERSHNIDYLESQMYSTKNTPLFDIFVALLKASDNHKMIALAKLFEEMQSLEFIGVEHDRKQFEVIVNSDFYAESEYVTTYKELKKIQKRGNVAYRKHEKALHKYKEVFEFCKSGEIDIVLSEFRKTFANIIMQKAYQFNEGYLYPDSVVEKYQRFPEFREAFLDFIAEKGLHRLLTDRQANKINRK